MASRTTISAAIWTRRRRSSFPPEAETFEFEWTPSTARVVVLDGHCERCGEAVHHIDRNPVPGEFDAAMIRALVAKARHEGCGGTMLIQTEPAEAEASA